MSHNFARLMALGLVFGSVAAAQVTVNPNPVPPAPTVASTPNLQTESAPTPEQAQALIERLLMYTSGPQSKTQVTYGLPAGLPLKLGAPFRVISSLRQQYPGNAAAAYRVMLDTPLATAEASAALRDALTAGGWKMQGQPGLPIGFEGNTSYGNLNFYREGSGNFMLGVSLSRQQDRTLVDMNVNGVSSAQLAQIKKAQSYVPRSSLPLLRALPGVTSKITYPTSGPSGALSSVGVQTDRSAGEVFNHYSAQLKAAGWKALTDTTTGPLRVVTYSLKDLNGREALGTLGIRPWEKDGGYVLSVSVRGFKP